MPERHLEGARWARSRLGNSHSWGAFYALCRRGAIPCVRVGRKLLFDPEVLDAWIAAGGDSADAPGDKDRSSGS